LCFSFFESSFLSVKKAISWHIVSPEPQETISEDLIRLQTCENEFSIPSAGSCRVADFSMLNLTLPRVPFVNSTHITTVCLSYSN
jgi:hypothetical protein